MKEKGPWNWPGSRGGGTTGGSSPLFLVGTSTLPIGLDLAHSTIMKPEDEGNFCFKYNNKKLKSA